MKDLILDGYVIFWKHFERQNSKDEDFLTQATCALCAGIAFLNVAQIIAYWLGTDLSVLYSNSRLDQLIIGGIAMSIGAIGVKAFMAKYAELTGREQINERYSRISRNRAIGIVTLAVCNLGLLFLVHHLIAISADVPGQ